MNAHIPGEWFAQIDETATVRDKDGQVAIFTHLKTLTGGRRDASQVASNARLAAAAPDLLEALQEALKELEAYANDDGDSYNNPTINAAIAKATGAE